MEVNSCVNLISSVYLYCLQCMKDMLITNGKVVRY
jgi:hypothetical protein